MKHRLNGQHHCYILFSSTVVLSLCAVPPRQAAAQCTADSDCTNGRLCRDNICVYPAGWKPESTPAQPAASPPRHSGKNWAIGAGAFGVVNAALIGAVSAVGMTMASDDPAESVSDYEVGGTVSFWVAGLLNAAGAPTVFIGGYSARRSSPLVKGIRGLRVTGWVFCGLQIAALSADGILLLTDAKMAPVFVGVHAILGSLSQAFFAIDAFVSGSQAKRQAASSKKQVGRNTASERSIALYPILSPVYRSGHVDEGAMLGVGLLF